MATAALKHEVDELRELVTELNRQTGHTELSVNSLSARLSALENEVGAFRDRKIPSGKALARNEKAFDSSDEAHRESQRIAVQWAQIADRRGTFVEDIVAPNLPRVAADLLGCTQPSLFALRVVRHWQGETREYDALLVCEDAVLVNETKSKLQAAHVDAFIAKLAELPLVFPEYAGRRLVGVLAGLAVDEGVVAVATRRGVAIMAMGEDTMQVLNPEAVRPAC